MTDYQFSSVLELVMNIKVFRLLSTLRINKIVLKNVSELVHSCFSPAFF